MKRDRDLSHCLVSPSRIDRRYTEMIPANTIYSLLRTAAGVGDADDDASGAAPPCAASHALRRGLSAADARRILRAAAEADDARRDGSDGADIATLASAAEASDATAAAVLSPAAAGRPQRGSGASAAAARRQLDSLLRFDPIEHPVALPLGAASWQLPLRGQDTPDRHVARHLDRSRSSSAGATRLRSPLPPPPPRRTATTPSTSTAAARPRRSPARRRPRAARPTEGGEERAGTMATTTTKTTRRRWPLPPRRRPPRRPPRSPHRAGGEALR